MQFMNIQEFYNKKIGKKVLFVTILYAICMLCFSLLIYLNKTEKSLKGDLALISKVEQKINQSIKINKKIDAIKIPVNSENFSNDTVPKKSKRNSEIFAAQYIDILRTRFPEFTIEISNLKKDQKQLSFDVSLKSETLWNRFIDILSFLEETDYPFVFIKSITLSSKDNTIGIDIKAELRLFYQEDDKRV
ncbi:hypothetical protein TISLANDTSLP1_20890 [Thermodesulfovibrio yellowstonii]|uniref:Uncharacterized protein n=3 Tax=Thermodesulfovibrio yellowstonii TaxID=28262 RepID=B5YHZ3_THEYD|nr:hypothetical protein THEYE_A0210 [Thermodesulfovibrio yellowstonii DSM 11347]GLI54396.1 hypothetical protein TISLANDTSLP1_20890 [Thermodesulfovibrio islandicus]